MSKQYLVQSSWFETIIDPEWKYVDDRGHEHTPNSNTMNVNIFTRTICEYGERHEEKITHYHCKKCQVKIEPKFTQRPYAYWIDEEIISRCKPNEVQQGSMYGDFIGNHLMRVVGHRKFT